MKLLKLINPENVSEEEVKSYPVREAVRAIVVDEDGKIALLHVTEKNYYKLPGGGIEKGEEKIIALKRECLEEIGCDVEVINEIGIIVEYRKLLNPRNLKQTSYCYLAKIKGEKGIPEFTESEKRNGFEGIWLTYDEALKALTESQALNNEGKYYIVPRDRAFLEEADNLVSSLSA
ncbi:MAG: NUDIX domain-containing protein [Patescibacteria group bacterium]